jgi:uncharacterized protein YqeY
MTIREQLEDDIKQAMRSGDAARRDVLRFLKSAIHNEEIEKHQELDDEGILTVVGKQVKQRRESIDMFRQASRNDLVVKEEGELVILAAYLPEQMSREEILKLAKQAISDSGAESLGDKGKVMGRLMPQVKGKADGTIVNEIVTKLLSGS